MTTLGVHLNPVTYLRLADIHTRLATQRDPDQQKTQNSFNEPMHTYWLQYCNIARGPSLVEMLSIITEIYFKFERKLFRKF